MNVNDSSYRIGIMELKYSLRPIAISNMVNSPERCNLSSSLIALFNDEDEVIIRSQVDSPSDENNLNACALK
tara:strand:- start:24 stop:239 length:216 start_codon:yes stop_codon:yes gene_type:complete